MQVSTGATTDRERAKDLLESDSWTFLLSQIRRSLVRYRNGLLTSPHLDANQRAEYLGRMRGTFDLIESVYKEADTPVPESITHFFQGEPE